MSFRSGDEERMRRRALLASTIGSVVEWFDFFVFAQAAALVFPRIFFSQHDQTTATLLSLQTFAVAYLARPVGGILFGHIGDRAGRKGTLIMTLGVMGVATLLIGLLPTGPNWAVALVALRILQGIGVGGEWGGGVLLSAEWARKGRRGLFAGFPQGAGDAGLALGAGATALTAYVTGVLVNLGTLPKGWYLEWGWRIPFWLTVVMVAIGLFVRLGVLETPVFNKVLEGRQREPLPVATAVHRQSRDIILGMLLRFGQGTVFYIFTVFVPVYGVQHLHKPAAFMSAAIAVGAAGSAIWIPLWAFLSDKVGRKSVFLLGATGTAFYLLFHFGLLDTGVWWIILIAVSASLFLHAAMFGPLGAILAEAFSPRYRYSAMSLAFQVGIIPGAFAPTIAASLYGAYHDTLVIGIYAMLMLFVSVVGLYFLRNRQTQDIDREYDLRAASRAAS